MRPSRVTSPSESQVVGVAIPSAGSGLRMGGRRKAFLTLSGRPLLAHSLRPFLDHSKVTSVVVALAPADAENPPAWLRDLDVRVRLVAGGKSRRDSVCAAIEALASTVTWVLVHDAARPLVTRAIIDRCIGRLGESEGIVAGWPVGDTLKEVGEGRTVLATPDRSRLWAAQTPQGFPKDRLTSAYRRAVAEGFEGTDDAEVYCRFGGTARIVEGSPWNLKVTHPEDLVVAEYLSGHSQVQEGRR